MGQKPLGIGLHVQTYREANMKTREIKVSITVQRTVEATVLCVIGDENKYSVERCVYDNEQNRKVFFDLTKDEKCEACDQAALILASEPTKN